MPFPARLSELTADWIDQALRAKGLLADRRVVAFEATPASGRGGTSSVRVLNLTYDGPTGSAPRRVLIKFSSEIEAVREAAREYRLYQREVAFYTHCGQAPGIRTPACYAAEYDERSNTCLLVLEYVENARSRDVYEGSPEDIDAAVRCLAPFHARWWAQGPSLSFVEHEYESSRFEKRVEKARKAFERIEQGSHQESFGETCFAILEFWLGQSSAVACHARSRPMTICHGSFHRDQLLFPEDGTKPPWVIDWQNVSTNIGAIDLARIIVSGLLPAQRRQHERRLVALYHTLLREHGVIDYPEQELLDDYRFGLMNVILFHSLILADYPVEVIQKYWSAPEPFWEVLFHNPAEAAKEWDVLGWMKRAIRSSASGT